MTKLFQFFVSLTALLLISLSSAADNANYTPGMQKFDGFIQVDSLRELYVNYVAPKSGKPTVVLVNGLTYSTVQWDAMTDDLVAKGIGVLRFDMYGQGKTLLKYAPALQVIPYQDQVFDLKSLLSKMQLKGPFNLVGLSYGGGIAIAYASAYPSDIKNLILMSPYTQPLQTQDETIKAKIKTTRIFYPFNPATDDELYDYFLRENIYTTYPAYEPVVLENPFKLEATFRLVQGIRKYFPIYETAKLPKGTVHLLIARQDQYIPNSVLDNYWSAIPVDARSSRIYINGSEHKIPEAVPMFSANLLELILSDNILFKQGNDFEAYPFIGEIHTGNTVIQMGN